MIRASVICPLEIVVSFAGILIWAMSAEFDGNVGASGVGAAVPAVTTIVPLLLMEMRSIRGFVTSAVLIVAFAPVTYTGTGTVPILQTPAAIATVIFGEPWAVGVQPEITPTPAR